MKNKKIQKKVKKLKNLPCFKNFIANSTNIQFNSSIIHSDLFFKGRFIFNRIEHCKKITSQTTFLWILKQLIC